MYVPLGYTAYALSYQAASSLEGLCARVAALVFGYDLEREYRTFESLEKCGPNDVNLVQFVEGMHPGDPKERARGKLRLWVRNLQEPQLREAFETASDSALKAAIVPYVCNRDWAKAWTSKTLRRCFGWSLDTKRFGAAWRRPGGSSAVRIWSFPVGIVAERVTPGVTPTTSTATPQPPIPVRAVGGQGNGQPRWPSSLGRQDG
jgi:hypothetical protein